MLASEASSKADVLTLRLTQAMTPARIPARVFYLIAVIATIALGLWVHTRAPALGADARDILGDALWAAMMTCCVAVLVPRMSLGTRGAVAMGICVIVELSQLVHTPALAAMRATFLGRLVLGSGFDARDFAAYAIGVIAAVIVERATVRWVRKRQSCSAR